MCNKQSYSKSGAEAMKNKIYFYRNKRLRVYKCDRCFKYHLTSVTDNKWNLDEF